MAIGDNRRMSLTAAIIPAAQPLTGQLDDPDQQFQMLHRQDPQRRTSPGSTGCVPRERLTPGQYSFLPYGPTAHCLLPTDLLRRDAF